VDELAAWLAPVAANYTADEYGQYGEYGKEREGRRLAPAVRHIGVAPVPPAAEGRGRRRPPSQ